MINIKKLQTRSKTKCPAKLRRGLARAKQAPLSMVLTILILLPQIVQAATFTDMQEANRYYTAIEYLTEVGVINGYPDGSFKSDNTVNRVEFLKLVLISSEIDTDIGAVTPFPDVIDTEWYAKYVRKAYNEGWIEGYPDGTFKPEQPINKVEALKIIGEVQQWTLPTEILEPPFADTAVTEWFTPYIAYAKDKNFLEEVRTNYIPETFFSRGRISELLFRSFITRKSGVNKFNINLVNQYPASLYVIEIVEDQSPIPVAHAEDPQPAQVNFTPVNFASMPADFFDNVTLDNSFPNTFYLNEVYYFNGTINTGSYSQAFIFLAQNGVEESINYPTDLTGNTFSFPVIFRQTGNYKIGLILGNTGESKIVEISVLSSLPDSTTTIQETRAPTSLNATYSNQNTTFSWNNEGYDLIRLTIYQGSTTKQFIFRQPATSFNAQYKDFTQFTEGIATYMIEGAELVSERPLVIESHWSKPTGRNFTATTHQFSNIDKNAISINNLPELLSDPIQLNFSGNTYTEIMQEAAIIKPDGFVDTVELTSSDPFSTFYGAETIPDNSTYTFSYNPETTGTYIMEINGTDGSAVLNTPVYIDTGIPLIPNFFDLYENNQTVGTLDLQKEIDTQLALINKERTAANLQPVVIDTELNNLAQLHSDDMVTRDFFGHINPDNETPNDRRLELGITTPVGENLAIAPTSEYTHYGLMQSGIHRKNILDPKWKKVGIGISKKSTNSLITTQEFSSSQLTETDLLTIKNNIFNAINAKRTSEGLNTFVTDSSLETPSTIWSQKMIDEDFFDFTSPGGEALSDLVRIYVPTKAIQALILEASNEETLSTEAVKSSEITNPLWQKIGIGIDISDVGLLRMTILFTTN